MYKRQLRFKVGPKSFYQTNSEQAYNLYKVARNFAGLTGNELVYDLYTGTGTIANFVSKHARQVIGIEYVPEAIEDAKVNAEINGIKNTLFFAGDMKDMLTQDFINQYGRPDVIITDPPRAGMHQDVVDVILFAEPKRIVYVSCDSATLARDLKILCDGGYEIRKVRGVDQFGMTVHVETVVLLSKGEIDSKKVRVEFSLEDMDMSGFQKGATYEQIKAYVLEHTGLKVSSLYISQIKRKCGLDVGQNYNLSKKEDAKVPKCPPEKEAAIRDALKYFQMI